MAKYELLEKAFIDNRIFEAGEIVDLPDTVVPGPHMRPVDKAAQKAIKDNGIVVGEIPDPINELTMTDAERLAASPQGVKSGMAIIFDDCSPSK